VAVKSRSSRDRVQTDAAGHLRMRDLVARTGLTRETIHYYLSEGLLPPAIKTGRNTALYTEQHLERLRRIQDLRERHFLPLKAIRSVLEEGGESSQSFTAAQRDLIHTVVESFRTTLLDHSAAGSARSVQQGRISLQDVRELERAGLISVRWDGDQPLLEPDDAEILDAWTQMTEVGISRERGFEPADAALYFKAIKRMVRAEIELFSARYSRISAADPSEVVRRAMPHIEQLISALHRKTMLTFIERLDASTASKRRAPD
jgi:DNA-binding transcriptional MerR regulator